MPTYTGEILLPLRQIHLKLLQLLIGANRAGTPITGDIAKRAILVIITENGGIAGFRNSWTSGPMNLKLLQNTPWQWEDDSL
jgi:hypothetical protein